MDLEQHSPRNNGVDGNNTTGTSNHGSKQFGMKLDDDAVRCLRQAKVFREFEYNINHIDFSPNSEGLVASGDDDQIVVYNCDTGQKKNVIFSKKYGVDLVQFAPRSKSSAIYASTKVDDTLRYLSLHDNKYIRYFKGHGKKVVGLHMSPKDAAFVSGSLDRTVRMWDLRSNNAVATIQISESQLISQCSFA
jgi:COMPASS component SWD2